MDWIIPLLAIIFVVIGAVLGAYINYKANRDSKLKQVKIEKLTQENKEIGNRNKDLNNQILDLSRDLNEISSDIKLISKDNQELTEKNIVLSEETIKLSKNIRNEQTGGDSFCYLILKFKGFPEEYREIMIFHDGKYVLRNIKITVEDLQKSRKMYSKYKDELNSLKMKAYSNGKITSSEDSDKLLNLYKKIKKSTTQTFQIGNIIPNTAIFFSKIILDEKENVIDWSVQISADNGLFYQRIKYLDIWGDMTMASVLKDSKGNILESMVSKDFPRNKDGAIKWED